MAGMTGKTLYATYQGILKTAGDNVNIGSGASAVRIVDGEETVSALYLSDSRVGIGTGTPSVQLDIESAASTHCAVDINAPTSTYDATLNFQEGGSDRGVITYDSGNNTFIVRANESGSDLRFDSSGANERMIIKSAGNVGIGTTSPDTLLDLEGSVSTAYNAAAEQDGHGATLTIQNTNAGAGSFSALKMMNKEASSEGHARIVCLAGDAGGNSGELAFTVENAGTFLEAMRIDEDGKVGIGTATPATKLHTSIPATAGAANITNAIAYGISMSVGGGMNTSNKYYPALSFRSEDPDLTGGYEYGAAIIAESEASFTGTTNDTTLHFCTSDGSVTALPAIQMSIDSAGNVGIGTNAPGDLLTLEDTNVTLSMVSTADNGTNSINFYENTSSNQGRITSSGNYLTSLLQLQSYSGSWASPGLCIKTVSDVNFVGIGNTSPATPLEVTGEILCGSAAASGAKGLYALGEANVAGTHVGVFHKTGNGSALQALGASSAVDDVMQIKNSSNTWTGTNMLDIDSDLNGSSSEYFIRMETGDEDPEAFIRCDGTFAGYATYGGGADYAEFFESKDGSALAPGSTVVLDGDKVRLAQDGESPIGVARPISSSAIIGNSPLSWQGKYKKDDSGGLQWEDYEMFEIESIDDDGQKVFTSYEVGKTDVTPPDGTKIIKKERRIVSDKYNKDLEYVSREVRDEWNVIGLVGQVPIKKGQPVASSWIKMSEISDSVDLYYIFPCAQIINNEQTGESNNGESNQGSDNSGESSSESSGEDSGGTEGSSSDSSSSSDGESASSESSSDDGDQSSGSSGSDASDDSEAGSGGDDSSGSSGESSGDGE